MNQISQFFVGRAHAAISSGLSLNDFANLFHPNTGSFNLTSAISFIVYLILLVGGIAAFIYLVIAGFNYITAGGDAAKATAARQAIINAVIGIIVIALSWGLISYVASKFGSGVPTNLSSLLLYRG